MPWPRLRRRYRKVPTAPCVASLPSVTPKPPPPPLSVSTFEREASPERLALVQTGTCAVFVSFPEVETTTESELSTLVE